MQAKPEPFWLTRDGAFKVKVEGTVSQRIVVYSWSDDAGRQGDWIPVIFLNTSEELERHFPSGSLHEFEVPNYPPGEEVPA